MRIVFCNDDLMPRAVDSSYKDESVAASEAGFSFDLIDFSALRNGDAESSARFVKVASELETAIYRGWMLTPNEYKGMHDALCRRNIRLITSPDEYLHCHWLPNSYSAIAGHTPRTVWMQSTSTSWDMKAINDLVKQFGTAPVIVKDYVKSRKHEWNEACFIPNASDAEKVAQIVNRFIELQDDDLQGGLVFREFVEFEPIGVHLKSGMPLTLEFRLFVFDGSVISGSPYWEGQDSTVEPPIEHFKNLLRDVRSRFFTCDVARTKDGNWMIVELGDAQVSGLPERCHPMAFYDALATRTSKL